LVYQGVKIGVQNSDKMQKVINQITVVGTILCVALLVLVKLGMHLRV